MHLHSRGHCLSTEEKKNVTRITIDAAANRHRIPDYVFDSCRRLTRVDLPDSITAIGAWAFTCCASLTDIRLPQGLTSIGDAAFSGCESLTCLDIPDGVSEIGVFAFHYCPALRHVNIPRGLQRLMSGVFHRCESLEQIYIPEGVERIPAEMFRGCSSLLYVDIPPSVHYIHLTAFLECRTLLHPYKSIYPSEETNGHPSDGTEEFHWDKFHDWLRTRYDDYPFLKTCWKKHVTMVDIEQCVEEHGIDCLLQVEKGTGWNGLDILFLNQFIGNDVDVLDLIANIILMLLCQKGRS